MKEPHIYVAPSQPATRFKIEIGNKAKWMCQSERALIRTDCCKQLRWAKNLTVQAYYDAHYYWCRPGKGCKR